MGRRPNALVTKFFERGQKLGDASNRYAQTCKRCEETFPRGRVDSLVAHLLRKCPGLTAEERDYVHHSVSRSHSEPRGFNHSSMDGNTSGPQHYDRVNLLETINFPDCISSTALETLAEISERHCDPTSQQLVQQRAVTAGHDGRSAVGTSPGVHALPQTAAAAGERLEDVATQVQDMLEYATDDHRVHSQTELHSPLRIENEGALVANTTSTNNHKSHTMLSQQPSSGFAMLNDVSKARARSRFSDVRRREVQEVRRRGACLRCRMLKKPCSEGTPCAACRNVDLARIWKLPCLRSKLVDEFRLWDAGLFKSIAQARISAAVHENSCVVAHCQVKVRPWQQVAGCMSFEAKCHARSEWQPPGLSVHLQGGVGTSQPVQYLFLLNECDQSIDQISEYIKQSADVCISQEPRKFLKHLIQTALKMIERENVRSLDSRSAAARTGHHLHGGLLQQCVDLWVATRIISTQSSDLDITCGEFRWSSEQPEGTCLVSDESRSIVTTQLRSVIEARCAALCISILNEFERRLLQRQQISHFVTFLSAVIALNCLERATGMFHAFDSNVSASEADFQEASGAPSPPAIDGIPYDATAQSISSLRHWPFDSPPKHFWTQGEHFADLLVTLLRVRALQPKVWVTDDGHLAFNLHAPFPGTQAEGYAKNDHEHSDIATAWLQGLDFTVNELIGIRDGVTPSARSDGSAWDLRFIAKLFLPDQVQ